MEGAAPIQRAIMNLDKETGISIMKIIEKLDAGPIMMKSKLKYLKILIMKAYVKNYQI